MRSASPIRTAGFGPPSRSSGSPAGRLTRVSRSPCVPAPPRCAWPMRSARTGARLRTTPRRRDPHIGPAGLLSPSASWAAKGPLYLSLGHVLEIIMKEPGPDHLITVTLNPHRIRVMLGGFIVAETTEALTLQEGRLPPVLYI